MKHWFTNSRYSLGIIVLLLVLHVGAAQASVWENWHIPPHRDPYIDWVNREVIAMLSTKPTSFNYQNPALRNLYKQSVERKIIGMAFVSEADILQGFSPTASEAARHKEFLDAVEALTEHFLLTGDQSNGRKAALILLGFYRTAPHWPVTSRTDQPSYQLDPALPGYGHWAGRIWTTWYFADVAPIASLARAYALLRDTDLLLQVGKEEQIDDPVGELDRFFEYWWRVYTEYWPPTWLNMEQVRINSLIDLAAALGRADWMRTAIRWFDRLMYRGFFRDGLWCEATAAYNIQVTKVLATILDKLQGYTDPPGYIDPVENDRMESLDAWARWGPLLERANTALAALRLPDGRYLSINDSQWVTKTDAMPESIPALLPAAGLAVLGSGEGADQFQVHLSFTATFGHEHKDALGLTLWAYGEELLSEGEYTGNREWQSSTAGHNTVVVDGRDQYNRIQGPQTETGWENPAIPAEDWLNRNAASRKIADLLLYDVATPGLMLAEASAVALYGPPVEQYRRFVAALDRPAGVPYVLDIFRVQGGRTHDWMVHGPLHEEYQLQVSLPLSPRPGTYHTWIHSLQSASTTEPFSYRIQAPGGAGVEGIVLPASRSTTVIRGLAPAMRREGDATFLGLQRSGPTNQYIVIHNPYKGEVEPLAVRHLDVEGGSAETIAVEVVGAGFRDVLISTIDSTGAYGTCTISEADVMFEGRFGWLRWSEGRLTAAALLGGGTLSVPGFTLTASPDQVGQVLDIGRSIGKIGRPLGPAEQHYVDVVGSLPSGTVLKDRILMLVLGDGSRHAVTIDRVEANGNKQNAVRVYLQDDPGIEITPTGAELVFFPNWHIAGPITYELLGRADWQAQ
ncbi:MAG: heparinase II/III domain-containing protein [Limnochordia bacterium]